MLVATDTTSPRILAHDRRFRALVSFARAEQASHYETGIEPQLVFLPTWHKMFPCCAQFVLVAVPTVELSREFASGGGKLEVLTPPQVAVAG
jgi:hypothetical protein